MPMWRALIDIETRRSAENGLSHWHYIVMADVQEHPYTSQKHLAQRIVRSQSRLVTDLDLLVSRRLLDRDTVEHDRRVNRLVLTQAGQKLTSRVRQQIHHDEDRLLRRLTERQRGQLRDLLTRTFDPGSL